MPDIELLGATYPDVPAVDLPKSGGGMARFYDPNEILYAASQTSGGPATTANALPYGVVDGSSTRTALTVTIPGVTTLYDGLCILVKNNVAQSNTNCTLNVNNLGAKRIQYSTALDTYVTTQWAATTTALFYYDSSRDGGNGAWVFYYGYDSNTNTIGYQIRTYSMSLPMKSVTYRYRILFTSADDAHFVPATNSTSTNATTARTVCQDPIDPFGRIVYYGNTSSVAAGSRPNASYLWEQYTFAIGYSFVVALTAWRPVYVKCAPQTDGSAIIDSTTPFVQALPTTDDGKIYIYLGVAYSETNIELTLKHPVYYYKDGQIRLWTASQNGLPSVSATDNGKILKVVNGAWTAETPSASGMLVTITKSGSTYTMDKTAAEIYTALASGIIPSFYDSYSYVFRTLEFASKLYSTSEWVDSISLNSLYYSFTATSANEYPSYTASDGGGGN